MKFVQSVFALFALVSTVVVVIATPLPMTNEDTTAPQKKSAPPARGLSRLDGAKFYSNKGEVVTVTPSTRRLSVDLSELSNEEKVEKLTSEIDIAFSRLQVASALSAYWADNSDEFFEHCKELLEMQVEDMPELKIKFSRTVQLIQGYLSEDEIQDFVRDAIKTTLDYSPNYSFGYAFDDEAKNELKVSIRAVLREIRESYLAQHRSLSAKLNKLQMEIDESL